MKSTIVFIALTLTSFTLSSQTSAIVQVNMDSVAKAYNEYTIYLTGYGGYFKDQKKYRVGFFNVKLKRELAASPEALAMYKTFVKHEWQGAGLMILGLGGSVFFLATANPLGFACLVPYTAGVIQASTGYKFYNQSIWTYNREAMLKVLSQ